MLCAAEITSIIGEDAKAAGLGGIYNVGRASTVPPRLVILKYTPTDAVAAAAPSIGLVGKGIVYDTGGLNLKSTGGRGMKGDMAGSLHGAPQQCRRVPLERFGGIERHIA